MHRFDPTFEHNIYGEKDAKIKAFRQTFVEIYAYFHVKYNFLEAYP